MTTTDDHPLVRAYLRRFDAAAARLPESRRERLRAEIAGHLREATSDDSSDAEVRLVLAELGDPGMIVGEEAATEDRPDGIRPAWIAGGVLLILSVVVGYALQWIDPLPVGISLTSIAWAAGLLVLAFGRPSVTARRPLGTAALAVLAIWSVAAGVVWDLIARTIDQSDPGGAGTAFGLVDTLGAFVLAAIAVVQIARIEVVPRPWRWAPAWVLAAVSVVWLINQLAGVTLRENVVAIAGGLVALDAVARIGGVLLLGALAIGLGSAVLRRPEHG
ncbi:hypothetical protein GCM10009840_32210 [Pseudolysinimonas kribbensis]|uniref:HAAS signaling domain-containing protein n=1 Tax=Pseudolysinimonas kribbensis TaxID=433641 RepID=UPI0031D93957